VVFGEGCPLPTRNGFGEMAVLPPEKIFGFFGVKMTCFGAFLALF